MHIQAFSDAKTTKTFPTRVEEQRPGIGFECQRRGDQGVGNIEQWLFHMERGQDPLA